MNHSMTISHWGRISSCMEQLARWCGVFMFVAIPTSTTAAGILGPLTVVLFYAAGGWRHKISSVLQQRQALLLLAFFGLFLIGLSYTIASVDDAWWMVRKHNKFLFAALLFPLFMEQRFRELALRAFMFALTVMLLLSYIKFFLHVPLSVHLGSDAAVFKGHILLGLLFSFAAYMYAHWAIRFPKYRWYLIAFCILALSNVLFMNIGRTGYVILLALMTLFCWQQFRWKGVIISVVMLVVLGGISFAISDTFNQRMNMIESDMNQLESGNSNTSIGLRIEFAKNSLRFITEDPFFGKGTNSLATAYKNLQPQPEVLTKNPHNEYLNITVQFGLFGLAVLLLMFYWQWRDCSKLEWQWRIVGQAILVSIMVGSLANSWLLDSTEGRLYAYFMMLVFSGGVSVGHKKPAR